MDTSDGFQAWQQLCASHYPVPRLREGQDFGRFASFGEADNDLNVATLIRCCTQKPEAASEVECWKQHYVTTDKAVGDLATQEQTTSSCTTTNVREQVQTFAFKNNPTEVDPVEVQWWWKGKGKNRKGKRKGKEAKGKEKGRDGGQRLAKEEEVGKKRKVELVTTVARLVAWLLIAHHPRSSRGGKFMKKYHLHH